MDFTRPQFLGENWLFGYRAAFFWKCQEAADGVEGGDGAEGGKGWRLC